MVPQPTGLGFADQQKLFYRPISTKLSSDDLVICINCISSIHIYEILLYLLYACFWLLTKLHVYGQSSTSRSKGQDALNIPHENATLPIHSTTGISVVAPLNSGIHRTTTFCPRTSNIIYWRIACEKSYAERLLPAVISNIHFRQVVSSKVHFAMTCSFTVSFYASGNHIYKKLHYSRVSI